MAEEEERGAELLQGEAGSSASNLSNLTSMQASTLKYRYPPAGLSLLCVCVCVRACVCLCLCLEGGFLRRPTDWPDGTLCFSIFFKKDEEVVCRLLLWLCSRRGSDSRARWGMRRILGKDMMFFFYTRDTELPVDT